jgi:hypothetical protein
MCFDTRKKADNFIRYNWDNILEEHEKAPVRSYYCLFCAAWHVTSNRSTISGERLDERDRDRIQSNSVRRHKQAPDNREKNKIDKRETCYRVMSKVDDIEAFMNIGELAQSEELLAACELDLKNMGKTNSHARIILEAQRRVRELRTKQDSLQTLWALGPEEKERFLAKEDPTDLEKELMVALDNSMKIQTLNEIIDSLPDLHKRMDKSEFHEKGIERCRAIARSMKATKKIKAIYNRRVDNIVREINERSPRPEPIPGHIFREGRKNVDGEIFRKTLLDVIAKIESLQDFFDSGDYDRCEDIVDVCNLILDDLGRTGKRVKIVRSRLKEWTDRISAASASREPDTGQAGDLQ